MANQNTPSVPEQEQDSNTLRQIRLEKAAAAAGRRQRPVYHYQV